MMSPPLCAEKLQQPRFGGRAFSFQLRHEFAWLVTLLDGGKLSVEFLYAAAQVFDTSLGSLIHVCLSRFT